MRKQRIVLTVGSVIVVMGLAAGQVGAADLSKAALITAGDKICKAGNDKLTAESTKLFSTLKKNEKPTPAMIKTLVGKAVPILRSEAKDLRKLTPPKADAAKIKTMLDDLDVVIGKISKDPQLMTGTTSPFAKVDATAVAYGFKECGSA